MNSEKRNVAVTAGTLFIAGLCSSANAATYSFEFESTSITAIGSSTIDLSNPAGADDLRADEVFTGSFTINTDGDNNVIPTGNSPVDLGADPLLTLNRTLTGETYLSSDDQFGTITAFSPSSFDQRGEINFSVLHGFRNSQALGELVFSSSALSGSTLPETVDGIFAALLDPNTNLGLSAFYLGGEDIPFFGTQPSDFSEPFVDLMFDFNITSVTVTGDVVLTAPIVVVDPTPPVSPPVVPPVTGGGTPVAPVPLPAAGWLLFAALGGASLITRRKS